ncbi:MAG: AhpC/TSA family protein [Cyanothece sp. SIO1E1]|nr:AhpC/TSA family protein [Cyanothece sp. SIO1E1]
MSLIQILSDRCTQSMRYAQAYRNPSSSRVATNSNLEVMGNRPLQVGDRAPDFSLLNAKGEPIRLQDWLTQGPVVLVFNRGQWCPYDNLELWQLQQALPTFKTLGANLAVISPQSLAPAEDPELTFEVLQDEDNQVARAFGLTCQLPASLRSVYAGFGIDVPTSDESKTFELSIHAAYVIAPDGTAIYAFVDPGYTQRLDPGRCLMALDPEYWLALV